MGISLWIRTRGPSHHNTLSTLGTPLGQRFRAHMIPASTTLWDLTHFLHLPLLNFVGLRRVRVWVVHNFNQFWFEVEFPPGYYWKGGYRDVRPRKGVFPALRFIH